jgi:predicted NACHT family NTPase
VEQKLLENPRVDSVAIDYKDKQAMLRQVAYHMQAADKGLAGNLIRGDDLERILTGYLKSIEVSQARTVARLLIEQLRSRNFILCYLGADSYAFVHRTFLEYFCACEFVERFGKRGLEGGLTLEELKTEVFGKHWQDESWHEVLCLIAGLIEAKFAGEIIDYLSAQEGEAEKFSNLFLAAKCLEEVRNRSLIASKATQLRDRLKGLTQYDLNYFNKPYRDLKETLLVRDIRTQAVAAVATTWKDEPDTLRWLKTCVQSDDNTDVRRAAVQELTREWKDDPDTLRILKTLAQSDDYPSMRRKAVEELARGWKDDPDTLPWLKTLAQSADNGVVRYTVVEELASGWKDDPDTLPIFKSLAQFDEYSPVRYVAVQKLASGWKDNPEIFEFLYDRAINDPFKRKEDWENNPRQTALEAIIEQYPNHPQTLPLLRDRAENDPDEKVREFAREKLEQ